MDNYKTKPHCCYKRMETFYQSPIHGLVCSVCKRTTDLKVLTDKGYTKATPTDIRKMTLNPSEVSE